MVARILVYVLALHFPVILSDEKQIQRHQQKPAQSHHKSSGESEKQNFSIPLWSKKAIYHSVSCLLQLCFTGMELQIRKTVSHTWRRTSPAAAQQNVQA